jgi:hypothetical protein
LVAKVGGFEEGMKKAARTSAKRMKEIEKNATAAGKVIGVAFVAVSGAITALVKSSINAADELSKMSQKVGVSTEELSGLKYAADLSDVSLESLSSALQKQGRNAVEAAKGTGAAAEAYAALGVSVKNADGTLKTNAQLFEDSAEAISKFGDGPKKQAIGVAIFGKAFADLVPLLNGGKEGLQAAREELERFGGIVDANTGKLAEDFNDTLTRIKTIVSGLGLTLAKDFLPHMREFVEKFKDPEFQKKIKDTVSGLTDLVIVVAKAGASLGSFLANVGKADEDNLKGLFDRAAALRTQIEHLESGGGILKALGNDPAKDLQGFRAELAKTEGQIEAMRKTLAPGAIGDIFGGTDGVTIPLRRPSNKPGLKDAPEIPDFAAQAKEQSEAFKLLQNDEEEYFKTVFDDSEKANEAIKTQIELGKELTESLMTPFELYDKQAASIEELYGKGYITAETRTRALTNATEDLLDGLDALDPTVEKASKELNDFAKQAAANITDAFADFLFDPFAEGLDGMIRGFADALQRMAANAAAAQIGQYIFGTQDKSGNLVGGLIQAGIGYFAGGTSGSTGAAASPGNMNFSIPESVGGGSIPVMPKVAASSTSKALVINQNFAIQAPQGTVSRQTQNQIATNAAKAASNALRRRNA